MSSLFPRFVYKFSEREGEGERVREIGGRERERLREKN